MDEIELEIKGEEKKVCGAQVIKEVGHHVLLQRPNDEELETPWMENRFREKDWRKGG